MQLHAIMTFLVINVSPSALSPRKGNKSRD